MGLDAPRRRARWIDPVIAAGLTLFAVLATRLAARLQPMAEPLDPLAYALLVLAPAALAVRTRWPVPVLATVSVTTSVYLSLGYPYGPIMFAYALAVYTAATALPIGRAAAAATLALACVSVHAFLPIAGAVGLDGLAPAAAWTAVPFAIGVAVRFSREAAVRSRAERARRIADDERLRVAQEIHDVVGHGLAAITMQAEIALHLMERDPQQAWTALTAISKTSRHALDELRGTLAVVRRGEDRAPAPGLDQLPALRDRLAAAGLPVSFMGTPTTALPAAIDLAAYRVVQEALTNVLRHAGTASATVHIEQTDDGLTVEVTDTGRGGVPAEGGGTGLAGMRERVEALGGTLDAGPRAGGGFRVRAVLPMPPEEAP